MTDRARRSERWADASSHEAGRLSADVAADPIERSWSRCNERYALDPVAAHQPAVLESGRVREQRDHHGEILQVARAEMHQLYGQIAGSGYSLLLTDAAGCILDYVGDETLQRDFRDAGLWIGALWDEENEGTNGIGTCIEEGVPVSVFRGQHFRSRHRNLSCSGAPIWGPSGELMAVLDASSVNDHETLQTQSHTLALVNISAQFLTKWRFLREFPEHVIVRFHRHCAYIGLVSDGVLAIDEAGWICGADRNACRMLGFSDRDGLVGQGISTVFQTSVEWLEGAADDGRLAYWSLTDARRGTPWYAHIQFSEGSVRARKQAQPRIALRRVEEPEPLADGLAQLAGSDPMMHKQALRAQRVQSRRIPVVLSGETGTGKERFAQALHEAGPRHQGPFVALDCASIPESLIESELFGYRGGAFTGAERKGRTGKVQRAHGGTLFLDEIGDMPVSLQTRLLRVLEEQEVVPLGGGEPEPVDIVVISATHRDLEEMVQAGTFREDLYYRLNGLTVHLPPLRARRDLPELLDRILRAEAEAVGDPVPELTDAARDAMCRYTWPGNIRQLRNVLRTAVALSAGEPVTTEELPPEVMGSHPGLSGPASAQLQAGVAAVESAASQTPLDDAECTAIQQTLARNHGNVSRAASDLGVSRNTLYRKLHKHGLVKGRQSVG